MHVEEPQSLLEEGFHVFLKVLKVLNVCCLRDLVVSEHPVFGLREGEGIRHEVLLNVRADGRLLLNPARCDDRREGGILKVRREGWDEGGGGGRRGGEEGKEGRGKDGEQREKWGRGM